MSLAELVAILSDPAEVAVGQGLEIPRSVDQYGLVPAIGGAQHKFQGLVRTCRDDGTRDGGQGAALSVANEKNLILTGEVADGE